MRVGVLDKQTAAGGKEVKVFGIVFFFWRLEVQNFKLFSSPQIFSKLFSAKANSNDFVYSPEAPITTPSRASRHDGGNSHSILLFLHLSASLEHTFPVIRVKEATRGGG